MKSGHAIRIESVRKNYGALAALDGLSLNIKAGEFTVLLGPSGSGKSTLIRSLAGIEKLDSGSIFFGDREVNRGPLNVAPEKRDLAMVFQDYALWPHLSALENVGYAMKRRKLSPDDSLKKVRAALSRVGLASKEANYPHQLSGGEQQRVALARAIVNKPALLLADEPTGNLDPKTSDEIMALLDRINQNGTTVVMATHDRGIVDRLQKRVVELSDGRIVRDQKVAGY